MISDNNTDKGNHVNNADNNKTKQLNGSHKTRSHLNNISIKV